MMLCRMLFTFKHLCVQLMSVMKAEGKSSAIYSHDSLKFSSLNLPSLQGLIDSKIITKSMVKKMATSDLNYAALKLAYCRAEEEGGRHVLSEECGGKPRVTRSTKIIHALAEHFKSTLSNES